VSKIKSPPEKKRFSLAQDRRNAYGECPTSSRRNIRRGKQRGHMEVRRVAAEKLRGLRGTAQDLDADTTEAEARARMIEAQRASFKKVPDIPLGVMVKRKMGWRTKKGRKTR
jgi:hypothetical protein